MPQLNINSISAFGPYATTSSTVNNNVPYSLSTIGSCGFQAFVFLNTAATGFPSGTVTDAGSYLQCFSWRYQGTVYNQCVYVYGNGSTAQTGSILPAPWQNGNPTSTYDYSNFFTYVYNVPSYVKASCTS